MGLDAEIVMAQGKQRAYIPVDDFVHKDKLSGGDPDKVVDESSLFSYVKNDEQLALLQKAMSGDMKFVVVPDTVDAEISDQNVGVAQVIAYDIAGSVAADGAGNIEVTFTSSLLDEPWVDDVALSNSDDATAIATAIESALKATGSPCHASTGVYTLARSTARLTFTANDEAANDETLALELGDFAGEETEISATEYEASAVAGVAPYVRTVNVSLESEDEGIHWWFNGTVPVTIGESVNDDGVASVATLNPVMVEGAMAVPVTLQKAWAANDTNTLTVSEATILGCTISAVTSVETSKDT